MIALVVAAAFFPTGRATCESYSTRAVDCAAKSPIFLQCVTSAGLDATSQCKCMAQSADMQTCLADCLQVTLEVLCGLSATPAAPPAASPAVSPAAIPAASSSRFLQYSATAQPLGAVTGSYVINLRRRPDRLESFFRSSHLQKTDVHVFEAYDGRALTAWSPGLGTLFGRNKFHDSRGIIGACLSHFAIWRHVATTVGEWHLVMEDDVEFLPHWIDDWNTKHQWSLPASGKILFLGGVGEENLQAYNSGAALEPVTRTLARHKENNFFAHDYDVGVDVHVSAQPSRAFHYHAMAYLLSSEGAKELVDFVVLHGFQRPVDAMLMKYMRQSPHVFATTPLLAKPPALLYNRVFGRDSDALADDAPVPRPAQQIEATPEASPPSTPDHAPAHAPAHSPATTRGAPEPPPNPQGYDPPAPVRLPPPPRTEF